MQKRASEAVIWPLSGLPPTVTEFEIPADVLALGDDFKYEIIARTATGNNTAVEACFLLD